MENDYLYKTKVKKNEAVLEIKTKGLNAYTEEILTIAVPVGTVSGAIAVITNGGQNATGPTFVVN